MTSCFDYLDIILRLSWHLLIRSNKTSRLSLRLLWFDKQFFLSSSHLENFFHLVVFRSSLLSSSFISSFFTYSSIIMNLTSSSNELSFVFLESLLRAFNEHADSEGYAVVLKRTEKSKNETINKTWIICEKRRKTHEVTDQNRRHCDSKHIECLFFIVVKLNEDIQTWFYEIRNSDHNHDVIIVKSHSILRRMTMTREMKNDIFKQLTVQTASSKILFTLRLDFANISTSFANVSFANVFFANISFIDDLNLLFKSRDIYNVKAKLRRDDLDSLTSVQALMRELNRGDDWIYFF